MPRLTSVSLLESKAGFSLGNQLVDTGKHRRIYSFWVGAAFSFLTSINPGFTAG
jgi:hypothetical protein